jgi:cysteinyl-tRNA synthetase
MRAVAGLVGLAVAGALLGGCSSSPTDAPAGRSSEARAADLHPLLDGARSFALALGADPSEVDVQLALAQHDLVVVDGATDPADIAALQGDGAVVLTYLSVGTVEPYRPWFEQARDARWLLDRWEDWDEWYADVREEGLRQVLLAEARRQLDLGVDGLFLDNVDAVDRRPELRDAMAGLVSDLDRLVGDDRVLFSQNGDPIGLGIVDHLDGWNREDVSFTFDRDADGYVPVGDEERAGAAEQLEAVAAAGPLVTVTDYLPAVDADLEAEATSVACAAGAVPFLSDIDLVRLPATPRTCD